MRGMDHDIFQLFDFSEDLVMVPGVGLEPTRLAAGDFELWNYSVSVGKRGEGKCRKKGKNASESVGWRILSKLGETRGRTATVPKF